MFPTHLQPIADQLIVKSDGLAAPNAEITEAALAQEARWLENHAKPEDRLLTAIQSGSDALPTRLKPKSSFSTDNARAFGFIKQTLTLLWKQFSRWLATVTFIVLILVVFKIYQGKGVITSKQKTTFNGIITALSLLLGLNFFVCRHHPQHVTRYVGLAHLMMV